MMNDAEPFVKPNNDPVALVHSGGRLLPRAGKLSPTNCSVLPTLPTDSLLSGEEDVLGLSERSNGLWAKFTSES
jgi:hypothetical protein